MSLDARKICKAYITYIADDGAPYLNKGQFGENKEKGPADKILPIFILSGQYTVSPRFDSTSVILRRYDYFLYSYSKKRQIHTWILADFDPEDSVFTLYICHTYFHDVMELSVLRLP